MHYILDRRSDHGGSWSERSAQGGRAHHYCGGSDHVGRCALDHHYITQTLLQYTRLEYTTQLSPPIYSLEESTIVAKNQRQILGSWC